ncbi:MAG: subclass B1 metallo-beta-lactamase [Ignavibacteriaceae bacterium]|nr:subclass B1 metallo-beta-lactamase [Ignavibacteriaceae bacterium]
MKRLFIVSFLTFFISIAFSQIQQDKISINQDIELIKINENAYVHISYSYVPEWGKIASNGLVFINGNEAALFDTPMTDSLTKDLVNWIHDSFKVKIKLFVPNHWHSDCMGGLAYLQSLGIESYANELTVQLAKSKNLPLPSYGFEDSITLHLGDKKIFCEFLGAAHSLDNIVIWIPSEEILFAGCMVKEIKSKSLGNTIDGDLIAYPETLRKVMNKYMEVKYIIPGHGQFGGVELIKHTLDLCSKK